MSGLPATHELTVRYKAVVPIWRCQNYNQRCISCTTIGTYGRYVTRDGSSLWVRSGRKHMKKLVRLFVVPAAALAVQAAFAATPVPQPPQPVPPIIQPYPGPIGPDGGPVDPTPTQPPPTAS